MSSLAFAAPMAVPLVTVARGKSAGRFVALQLLSSLTTLVLIALSFALGQPSFIRAAPGAGLAEPPRYAAACVFSRALAVKAVLLGTVLGAAVIAGWFSVVGFARLRAPLDRLHCVTLLNLTAGTLLAAAAVLRGGERITSRIIWHSGSNGTDMGIFPYPSHFVSNPNPHTVVAQTPKDCACPCQPVVRRNCSQLTLFGFTCRLHNRSRSLR